nr:retrovirus-related Pol polyprotein from transposon TNT 1-94 [Tanacetum cinerariifolium]
MLIAALSLPLLIKYLVTLWEICLVVSDLKIGCDYAYKARAVSMRLNYTLIGIDLGTTYSYIDVLSARSTTTPNTLSFVSGLTDVVRTRGRTSSASTNSGLRAAGALNSKINENLDVDTDDEVKDVLLVISLLASYKHFKEIMLYDNRETLSFDDVRSALLSKQKYDDDVEPENGEGLVARGRSSDRGESSNKNKKHQSQSRRKYSNKSCKYCKKLGHIVSDCYKLNNKLEREGKGNNEKKPEKATGVAIAKGDSDGDVYLAIDTEKSRDELIVDSGCTFHMIPHRSWFTTYESFDGGNVYMGNHSICPIIGKGNIQVKMHEVVVRTITEGALVLTKAIQSGGLYVLQGNVVYGTAGVATSKASLDDSKLWHYRLGHMGEKGMKNLAKKERGMLLTTFILIYEGHLLLRLEEYGIARHHTLVRTPQQNGVAERMNRTIMEKVRCMLSHVNLDKDFWVEAATTTTYLINRSPHRFLVGNIPKYYGQVKFEFDVENSTHTQPPFNDEHIETHDDGNMPTSPQSQTQTKYLLARDRERRQVNRPPRLEDYQCDLIAYAFATAAHIKNCEPTNYLEAISSPECDKWVVAMEREVESLHKNETWELVKLPKEKRVISCKWLFKVKDGISGVESNRYKARYVVRGFDQREGIDFNEVFSPVVRYTSIRVLLSIVALQDLDLEQLDVKTTFLGHLEEEIYVEQPEGFKVPGKEDQVCRLKKSLYGLKQSPRQWYKRFDFFMIGHGYDRCSYDECVYLRKFPDESFLYLVLYVDDMLIAAPNKDQIRELKDQLSNEFDMKDLRAAKKILGMEIQRDRKMVGSLMYAMVCTRSDLAHAVSVVSRYMHNLGKMHWKAVKCIIRYLKWTSNIGLSFEKGRASPNGVVGYVDFDYAGDLDARKSLSSYIFSHCGSAISWYSSLQAITALSTTEAEYISSTEGVEEAIWLRGMVNEFGLPQELALLVFDTHRGAATTTMKSYGFWFKMEIVGIVSQKL